MSDMGRPSVNVHLARLIGVMALGWLVAAPAASAHAAGDVPPATDYLTTIEERPSGIDVQVIDGGDRLDLRLAGAETVIVSGFADEPMLRVDRNGVAGNRRSPSLYSSRTRDGGVEPPADADPTAEPEWVTVSDQPILRWHDHRAHWMSPMPAPEVERDPSQERVVMTNWRVPLVIDGQPAELVGDVTWMPRPASWPWWLGVIIGSLGVVALADVRPRLALWGGTALAAIGVVVTIAGAWDPDPGDMAAHLVALAIPVAWFLLVPVGARMVRTSSVAGVALTVIGSVGTLALVAWPRRGVVAHAVVVSNWSTPVTQLALGAIVVGAIGAIAGSSGRAFGGDRPGFGRRLLDRGDQLAPSPEHAGADGPHGHVEHRRGLLVRAPHHPRQHQGLPGVER